MGFGSDRPTIPSQVPHPSMTEAQRRGQPMTLAMIALMILILTLIFSFPYLVSDDWGTGAVIAVVGIGVVAMLLYFGARREIEIHQKYGQGWLFDRKNMFLGFMLLIGGLAMIILGGPLTSVFFLSIFIMVLGVAFVFGGMFWIVMGLRG